MDDNPDFEVGKARAIMVQCGFCYVLSCLYKAASNRSCKRTKLVWLQGTREMHAGESTFTSSMLDQDWGIYLKQKEDLSQARPYALTAHRYQVAHNLMGYSEDPFVLSGDIFEMNSFIPEENDIVTVVRAYQSRIHLAYIMCNDEQGVKLASELFGKVPEKN